MSGIVFGWCNDLYHEDYYIEGEKINPVEFRITGTLTQ